MPFSTITDICQLISLHALPSGKAQTEFNVDSTNNNYIWAQWLDTKLHTGDLAVSKVPAHVELTFLTVHRNLSTYHILGREYPSPTWLWISFYVISSVSSFNYLCCKQPQLLLRKAGRISKKNKDCLWTLWRAIHMWKTPNLSRNYKKNPGEELCYWQWHLKKKRTHSFNWSRSLMEDTEKPGWFSYYNAYHRGRSFRKKYQ